MIRDHRPAQRRETTDANQIAAASRRSLNLRDVNAHPETATGHRAIWLQSFKRKFSFFDLDDPSMSNPDA